MFLCPELSFAFVGLQLKLSRLDILLGLSSFYQES